jgi:hypothetical protein
VAHARTKKDFAQCAGSRLMTPSFTKIPMCRLEEIW